MDQPDLSGTVLDGRYQVIEPIADGAMGSVYRGERLNLGRAVAIKIMHEQLPDELASRQRFEREAKLMALLEHPNCVSVIDFGVHEEKPYLVMELVRGQSLIDLIEKSGQLELGKACDIVRQVLSGLAHAHELGIVHRDIKPANIMISEKAGHGMQVRILDFGLARLTETSTKLTTGIVVGTPNYMSPEQCKGGDIDARTDLYACGVMLFEMLTGRKPFLADDPIQVVRKHLMEKPPTLAAVEPRINFGKLEEVVAKALAKAPKDRYDSAVEMSKAIEAAAKALASTVFARAVPESKSPAIGNVQATMSGWNVPASPSSSPMGDSSLGAPVTDSQVVAAKPPPSPGDSSLGAPVTESQFIDTVKPPPHSPLAGHSAPGHSATAGDSSLGQPVTESQFIDTIKPPPHSPLAGPTSGAPAHVPSSVSGPTSGAPGHVSSNASGPTSGAPSLMSTSASGPSGAPSMMSTSASGPSAAPSMMSPSASGPGGAPSMTSTSASGPGGAPSMTSTSASGPGGAPSMIDSGATPTTTGASGGTPNRSIQIPPTRPAVAPRAGLPLPPKKLAMIGGGVVALIVIIAIVASGGSKKSDATKAAPPPTPGETALKADEISSTIERSNQLIAQDDPEAAVSLLTKARKASPDNAQLALTLGRAYFAKLWWSEGVKNFRDAVRLDPSLKDNPDMLKAVLKGFLTTPDVDDRIADFMLEIGDPMKAYLQETADKHPNKALRARAKSELRRYR